MSRLMYIIKRKPSHAKFRGWRSILEKRENVAPRKFGIYMYILSCSRENASTNCSPLYAADVYIYTIMYIAVKTRAHTVDLIHDTNHHNMVLKSICNCRQYCCFDLAMYIIIYRIYSTKFFCGFRDRPPTLKI